MKRAYWALAAMSGLMLTLAGHANATLINFNFAGPGVSGSIALTYDAATDAKYPDAYEITGISGIFSDSNIGIVDAAIGSLVAVKHDTPDATNLLAPNDFSRFAVASGLSPQSNGFLTYDNLSWPGGSQQTASDYSPHGGFLDIYGLMFNIDSNRVVNIWSNGVRLPGTAPDYGVAVATSETALDYVGGVTASAVPEPGSLYLVFAGMLALLVLRRRAATA